MMYKSLSFGVCLLLGLNIMSFGQEKAPKTDEFTYNGHKLTIHFLGHATLMFNFNGTIIHVDPVSQYGAYNTLPGADLILITHTHGDHLDSKAIAKITKKDTVLLLNKAAADSLKQGTVLDNGQKWEGKNLQVEAVPAYNTTKGREQFHPRGRDNGYILTLGQKRIYIAGDTEDIPELAALKPIDIAFLPINQPYTMTPEQFARAVKLIRPGLVYPYHYGNTDVGQLAALLKDLPQVELRIRELP